MSEMSELTLLILRIGFLLLLWLFIFAIVYALRSDLFGTSVRRLRSDNSRGSQAAPQAAPQLPVITPTAGAAPSAAGADLPSAGTAGEARQLVITSGVAAGTSVPLDDDVFTIGRSSDSSLVIVDEYTSTYHARLSRQGEQWLLTDLDSTNGTKVDGTRVNGTVMVHTFTPVTIGTTTFELRP